MSLVALAPATATELLAKNAVLLLEVLDALDLAAVHPAANTKSKNWSCATDIVSDSTARRLELSRLHVRSPRRDTSTRFRTIVGRHTTPKQAACLDSIDTTSNVPSAM